MTTQLSDTELIATLQARAKELEAENAKLLSQLADCRCHEMEKKLHIPDEKGRESKKGNRKSEEKIEKMPGYNTRFMSHHSKRYVALKVTYFGKRFYGFASEAQMEPTVESELFKAFEKTRLLVGDKKESQYSRCGRTDKGVSSVGQIPPITIIVLLKSKDLYGKCYGRKDEQVIALFLRSNLKISATNNGNSGVVLDEQHEGEIDYVGVLNRVLPNDIRIMGWCPAPVDFHARFSCLSREYKYFFWKENLNIPAIEVAGNKLVGEHDFRNFCKMDAANVHNYRRCITLFEISSTDVRLRLVDIFLTLILVFLYNDNQLWVIKIRGSAFLWHQVRCMVAVLFMVGKGLESPNVGSKVWDNGTMGIEVVIHMGEKAKELDNSGFKLWYTGKIRSRNGVGIIVDKEWKKDVVDVRRVGDRIIVLKLVVGQDTFNVISGYAPQVGLAEHFKVARGFEGVHGGFGLGEMNGEGKSILEFSEALDLSIANTWFKKREEHLITYKSGGTCSQIDFFLIRKSDRKYCLNCKVIPGESLTTQHRVLVMDVRIRDRAKRRSPLVAPRIKWWHLKGEKQGIFQQKIWEGWCGQSQGSANDMWNKMSQEIIKVAKETLGESRGFGPRGKESWWWNENVQSKVRVKKECFKEWSRCRNSETWDKYKIARNETKKAVSEARAQAFDGLYQALGTRDGERSIYRLAKGRERKTRDLDQVKCVKDEEGKVLVHEKDIKERWKAYFHNLFNDGYGYDSSSLDTREEDRNYKYYRRIQKQEVKEALKRMSNGKAVGPDNIPIEVWKTLGDRGLEWLTELFNEIMRSKRMPEEWRRSTLVPIYKNKGDIQNCANYRGIKLMSHTMKLWERVIERRLRKETQVTENQFGFMPGRSTMEAIYLLRRVMEQYRMAQQDLHLIFIDLEKAYDRVPREILWKALEKKGVRVAYIRAIQDMYDRVSTSVRTQGGESDDFPITIGLHQGSTLSPYLFTLILDVLTEQIQEIAPRCMFFADDIVLLGESREKLNERLETWRRALETHGFRLSRSKSEYMECKFNKRRRVSNSEVKIGDHIIPQVTRFKYLGSVIQDDGEIEGDVNHRIQAGWMKWRKASGVLCDAKVPIKLKGKFYRTAVRPAILYGTECWAVKSQHENKVGVAEMRMLRWMCGKTRQDKIRNEAIRERVGVAPIVEKMVENRLRWFGHVERRSVDSVVRRVDQMERRQTIRGRGRPKKTIREVIKKDLEINGLDRSMVIDMLLDTSRILRKPQYTMASEVPLVLQSCEFDNIKFMCSSDAGEALRVHLVNECQIYQLQAAIFHEALLNCVPLSNDQSLLPFQGSKKKVSHVPLMSRPTEPSYEERRAKLNTIA
ncbi:tRNA pseudouridine(38/39) synthase [Glycine max]|nr:tRNA pseudouridine(38/39) synthase [Glycine max]